VLRGRLHRLTRHRHVGKSRQCRNIPIGTFAWVGEVGGLCLLDALAEREEAPLAVRQELVADAARRRAGETHSLLHQRYPAVR
jgi:hypothetical protein